jgi:glycosyltransferase involved in cell wall biosynthesis
VESAQPEVSVVIPVRDGWPDVKRAVASALGQRGVAVEVLVADDTEPSIGPQMLDFFTHDTRLRVLRPGPPGSRQKARNEGAVAARAGWVAFLDHDDAWAPDKLRRQLDAVAESGADWSFTGAIVVDECLMPEGVEHAPSANGLADLLRRRNAIPGGGSSVLVRRDLFLDRGGFDPAIRALEDWEMWLRLADRPAAPVAEPLMAFVRLAGGSSAVNSAQTFENVELIEAKHRDEDVRADIRWLTRWIAGSQRRGGLRMQAVRTYLRGARRGDFPGGLVRAAVALLEPRRPPAVGRAQRRLPAPDPDWLKDLRAQQNA